jgi:additional sex combs-like protein
LWKKRKNFEFYIRLEKALEAELKAKKAESPPSPKAKTMKDVLASIPGFGAGRPRKRHNRKLSMGEQLEQTKKEGCIDLETPRSILTQVNLRTILNKHTFSLLPPLYQYKLIQLLPEVDAVRGPDNGLK